MVGGDRRKKGDHFPFLRPLPPPHTGVGQGFLGTKGGGMVGGPLSSARGHSSSLVRVWTFFVLIFLGARVTE